MNEKLGTQETSLKEFEGNQCLTEEEKEYRLRQLEKELAEGSIDEEMWPYLSRLNAIDGVVTTQCCCGHNKKDLKPHIDIRISFGFIDLFDRVRRMLDMGEVSLQIMGAEMNMPRYCFWLSHDSWQETMEELCEVLEP